jgi:hypothetical protein
MNQINQVNNTNQNNPNPYNQPSQQRQYNQPNQPNEVDALLQLATYKLKPKTLEKLKEFISKQKKLSKEQLEIIMTLIKNQE